MIHAGEVSSKNFSENKAPPVQPLLLKPHSNNSRICRLSLIPNCHSRRTSARFRYINSKISIIEDQIVMKMKQYSTYIPHEDPRVLGRLRTEYWRVSVRRSGATKDGQVVLCIAPMAQIVDDRAARSCCGNNGRSISGQETGASKHRACGARNKEMAARKRKGSSTVSQSFAPLWIALDVKECLHQKWSAAIVLWSSETARQSSRKSRSPSTHIGGVRDEAAPQRRARVRCACREFDDRPRKLAVATANNISGSKPAASGSSRHAVQGTKKMAARIGGYGKESLKRTPGGQIRN
nr:hypothetical protein Iba_chr03dCG5480 [Ipomoea batatas]